MSNEKFQLKLMEMRVPFLYASSLKNFEFKNIEDAIKPIKFEKNRTIVTISMNLEEASKSLSVTINACFSLNNVVVAAIVTTRTTKANSQSFTKQDVDQHRKDLISPAVGKMNQLISVATEQLTGFPYSANIPTDSKYK